MIAQPKEMIAQFVQDRTKMAYPFKDYSALGLVRNGELRAGVIYDHYTPPMIMMHVAAVEGRRWLNRAYLFACFDYPLNQLGCNVVVGTIAKKNAESRRFAEHLGFRLCGEIPEAARNDDMLIYAMRKTDCRWLRRDN